MLFFRYQNKKYLDELSGIADKLGELEKKYEMCESEDEGKEIEVEMEKALEEADRLMLENRKALYRDMKSSIRFCFILIFVVALPVIIWNVLHGDYLVLSLISSLFLIIAVRNLDKMRKSAKLLKNEIEYRIKNL